MIRIILGILIFIIFISALIAFANEENFWDWFKEITIGLAIFIVLIAVAVACAWLIVSGLNSIIG